MLANKPFIIYNQVSMSIPNFIHKIKSKSGIDKVTIMYLCIIVGVGIGSFGLGRLSISEDRIQGIRELDNSQTNIVDKSEAQTKEKRYVASKNGKLYYSIGCSGANRIKEENEVWFSSQTDAEKSGYTMSSTCK